MPDDLLARAAAAGVPPLLLSGSPWAIRQDMLATVMGAARFPERAGLALVGGNGRTAEQPTRRVAVVPLTGVITPQGSFLDFLFGGSPGGLLGFRQAFDEAIADPEVEGIVIDVDSPGGLVDLVPETAQHVRESRGAKPIVAVADTLMASAAYWIGSQADEVVITPSGYAGSVGVYRMHIDESGLNEQLGLKVTYVSAGKYKTDGNPDGPLSDSAQEDWQQAVDDVYTTFVDDVAAGRGTTAGQVIADYGEGRVLNARRAFTAGLVDRVETYEATIDRLLGASSASVSVPAEVEARLAALTADLERVNAEIAALQTPSDPDPPVAIWSLEERAFRARLLLT
jgi:signal peptide peptidase SppA